MGQTFRVGLTADFLKPDGTIGFGDIGVETLDQVPGIEWELEIDRAQGAKFNADISNVGNVIKLITNGIKLGE